MGPEPTSPRGELRSLADLIEPTGPHNASLNRAGRPCPRSAETLIKSAVPLLLSRRINGTLSLPRRCHYRATSPLQHPAKLTSPRALGAIDPRRGRDFCPQLG